MLVKNLALLHSKEGHSISVAAFEPCADAFRADVELLNQSGVSVFAPNHKIGKFGRLKHFSEVMRFVKPDVIFAHSVLPSFYGRIAKAIGFPAAKFVTVLHSATNDDYSDRKLQISESISRGLIDQVVAVSDRGKASYEARFGVDADVVVIKNGIDLSRFDFRTSQATRLTPRANPVVLQVGRISRVKQQCFVYQALLPYLKSKKIEIWYAGLTEEVDYQAELQGMVRADGVSDQVKFLGSRDDVPLLLRECAVYVMPSLQEAHSVAMMEALASGVSIVASTIEAFDFAKGIPGVRLVDPTSLKDFRQAVAESLVMPGPIAREIDSYSISRTAREYIDLCVSLLARK